MRFLIGLVGHARHGKNTVASFVAEVVGEMDDARMIEVAFADGVREECRAIYGWSGVKDEAGRTLLQEHGMKRRAVDPDYWVKRAFDRIDAIPADVVVITDVRFRNEAAAIAARGGELWRVTRFDERGGFFDGGLTPEQRRHPSETELDGYPCDRTITNVGLASLRRAVRAELLGPSDARVSP